MWTAPLRRQEGHCPFSLLLCLISYQSASNVVHCRIWMAVFVAVIVQFLQFFYLTFCNEMLGRKLPYFIFTASPVEQARRGLGGQHQRHPGGLGPAPYLPPQSLRGQARGSGNSHAHSARHALTYFVPHFIEGESRTMKLRSVSHIARKQRGRDRTCGVKWCRAV